MKENLELLGIENFIGSEHYHTIMGKKVTDGVAYILENGYGWVVTDALVILSMKAKVKRESFVTVKLKLEGKGAKIVYDDGNGNILFTQKYEITDAKRELTLFWVDGILMLNSEY
jgi:hypothetical protein